MQQAVHAVQVDERAEVREVLDGALHPVARLDRLEEDLALFGALGLDHFAAGEDDVLALVVHLDDFEFVDVAHVFVQILGRNDVHLGAGQKGLHAHVDHQAALHHALDLALHEAAFAVHGHDLFPVLLVGGLLLGEDDQTFVVLEALQEHLDLIPHFNFLVFKLRAGDHPFGFVADVHKNHLRPDFKDRAVHDVALVISRKLAVDQGFQFFFTH